MCLYLFKIAAIAIHILTCILIYQTTKRKKLTLLYGINPFLLFEMITNVHNDLYLIFFIMLAIYFWKKRNNILAAVFALACATVIKYVALLLVPFLLLYHFKSKTIPKKLLYSFLYGILYLGFIVLFYLIYIRDFNMISNIFMQQGKYRESIFVILVGIERQYHISYLLKTAQIIFMILFAFIYVKICMGLLLNKSKKITFQNIMRKYGVIIFLFVFFIITNLCPWYTSWIFPCIVWLRGKTIKTWIYLQFSYELCIIYNFALHSESYKIGYFYLFSIILFTMIFEKVERNQCKKQTSSCVVKLH